MRVDPISRMLYSPFLVQIVPTRRCNLTCGYCNEYDRSSKPVPVGLMIERLDKCRELGAFAIEFSGGEPLLHPAIVSLVDHCRRRFWRRMVITNGFLLSESRIEDLNRAGLTDLQISIDGVVPNGTTQKVLRRLQPRLELLSRQARFRVTINAVVGSAPLDEVEEVLRVAEGYGFARQVGLMHFGGGGIALAAEQRARFVELIDRLGGGRGRPRDFKDRLLREGRAPFRCRAGARYLYVDEHGVVRYCSQRRELLAKELMDFTAADLREHFHTVKPCADTCTIGCVRNTSRPDRWRPQVGRKTTDESPGTGAADERDVIARPGSGRQNGRVA